MKKKMATIRVTGKNLVSKWEKTGLLQELPDYKKLPCAKSLEEMAQVLINKRHDKCDIVGYDNEKIAGTLLPIVRLLYNENIAVMPFMSQLYDDYISFISGDMEAFICQYYIKDYVDRLKFPKNTRKQ
jgi:hypothetical protein